MYVRVVPAVAGPLLSCAGGAAGTSGMMVVVEAERCGEDIVGGDCAFQRVSFQFLYNSHHPTVVCLLFLGKETCVYNVGQ